MTQVPFISLFNDDDPAEYRELKRYSQHAAAVDLRARIDESLIFPPGVIAKVPLGICLDMSQTPDLCALILPRSGIGGRGFTIMNCVGLIDPDYQGEITASMVNHQDQEIRLNRGDRIAQLLIMKYEAAVFIPTEKFTTETERGKNGGGSTGVK